MREMTETRRTRYSLIELLAVIGLVLILMNATLALFYKGSKICALFSSKAELMASTSVLKKNFRSLVHENGELLSVTPNMVLFKDGAGLAVKDNSLLLAQNGELRRFALPAQANASFSLEQEPELGSCLALRLDFHKKESGPSAEFIRIVAGLEPAEESKDAKSK